MLLLQVLLVFGEGQGSPVQFTGTVVRGSVSVVPKQTKPTYTFSDRYKVIFREGKMQNNNILISQMPRCKLCIFFYFSFFIFIKQYTLDFCIFTFLHFCNFPSRFPSQIKVFSTEWDVAYVRNHNVKYKEPTAVLKKIQELLYNVRTNRVYHMYL